MPLNQTFYQIIKALYSEDEADMVVKIPYVLSNLERIIHITRVEKNKLKFTLEKLCKEGLVIDLMQEENTIKCPRNWL